jgi:toxin FitB
MKGFLLDTNVPSELTRLRSEPKVEAWLDAADDNQLFLSVITLGEIVKGLTLLADGKRRDHIRHWLDNTLRPWFQGRILPIDEAVAERWGILTGESQTRGVRLNATDGLIAATALAHDLTVVTRNVKDFIGLGLQTFNPWD